jgi:hypothetical protein
VSTKTLFILAGKSAARQVIAICRPLTILLPPGQSARVNASYLQPFFSYTTPSQTTFTLQTESTYNWAAHRASRGWDQSGAQDRKPADQHHGEGEILARASGWRARLMRAVRSDILISEVTVSTGFGKLAVALG